MHTVAYCDYYNESCNDPAFYTWNQPEWVCTVYVEDKCLELWTVGDMRINMPNGDVIRYADDLFYAGIDTDEKLHKISDEDEAFEYWINNSWLEIRDYEGQWIGDTWSGHIWHDVREGIEGCIALLTEPEFLAEYPCKNPNYVVGSAND